MGNSDRSLPAVRCPGWACCQCVLVSQPWTQPLTCCQVSADIYSFFFCGMIGKIQGALSFFLCLVAYFEVLSVIPLADLLIDLAAVLLSFAISAGRKCTYSILVWCPRTSALRLMLTLHHSIHQLGKVCAGHGNMCWGAHAMLHTVTISCIEVFIHWLEVAVGDLFQSDIKSD